MQIDTKSGGTIFKTLGNIFKHEGVPALYNGLSAALTRQLTYTTLRLGIFL